MISTGWMQPQLLRPVNGDTLNYLEICFQWTQTSNTIAYQLQIADFPDFAEPIVELTDSTLAAILTGNFQWDTEYYWRIRSISLEGEFGTWSESNIFWTNILPDVIPTLNTITYLPDVVSPGITILDQLGLGYIFGIDLNGNPVWFLNSEPLFDNGLQYLLQFTGFLPNGNIIGIADGRLLEMPGRAYEITIDNELVWTGPDNLENLGVHHDVIGLPNGNKMALTSRDTLLPVPEADWPPIEIPDSIVWRGDRIVEWDEFGNEVWNWDMFDHYNLDDWIYEIFMLAFGLGIFDWTHSNAIWYDEEDDAVYISVRYMSRITKIDHSTGDILWNMGMQMPSGDVQFGSELGFSRQHSIKVLENRNLMMYDNGNENEPPLSRGLEISITETDSIPIAEVAWEYVLPENVNSGHMSDCDRLPNENSLLTSTDKSHVLEVSQDSQLVWEVYPDQDFSTYRGERIPGLYPQVYSVIQPDFINGENGPTLILPLGETSLSYTIYNEGWLDEEYTFSLEDDEGWFSESGIVEINSGNQVSLSFTGDIIGSVTENLLTFTIIPSQAPDLEQFYHLILESELSIGDQSRIPGQFRIHSVYPNPFNAQTMINFELPYNSQIELSVYNLEGKKVIGLLSGYHLAGKHLAIWDGKSFSSGVYLVKLESPRFFISKKVVLLK